MNAPAQSPNKSVAQRNLHTGLVLAMVALAMFAGFILRGWVMGQ